MGSAGGKENGEEKNRTRRGKKEKKKPKTLPIPRWFRPTKNWDGSTSSICSHRLLIRWLRPARFACVLHCAHLFARSLTPDLVGK